MSALGQKRTFAPQNSMSALPPIATAKADFRVSYPNRPKAGLSSRMSCILSRRGCPPLQVGQRLTTVAAIFGIAPLAGKQPSAMAAMVLALPFSQPSPAG